HLVCLDIGDFVVRADGAVIVVFGKEARSAQYDRRQAMFAEEELTERFRRNFGHTIDIPRDWRDVLGHPDSRLACCRRQRRAECARRAGEDEGLNSGSDRFLQQGQCAGTLTSTKSRLMRVATCGLCRVAACMMARTPSRLCLMKSRSPIEPTQSVNGDGLM